MQRRPEFSFQGSPAREARALPPRPRTTNPMAPRSPWEEEIRWLQASRQGSPDSGTPPSPQPWTRHHHEHLLHHHRPYPASVGSSPSRAQAIAGYRREMLDLVRGLPESTYELSLRDIVERPSSSSALPPTPKLSATDAAAARDRDEPADIKRDATAAGAADVEEEGRTHSIGARKQGRRKQRATREQRGPSIGRSVSLDTGLLIKLFLPLSIGGGGKKKVSPKPDAAKKKEKKQGKKKGEATQDEEWWTKSEFSEAASSSRTSSTGSSNSAGSIRNGNGSSNPRAPMRSRSRKRSGCYAFFRANKSNNGGSQD